MVEHGNTVSNPERSERRRSWPGKLALGGAAVLGAVVGAGAMHLRNHHERNELRKEARTDPLTGLSNRRGFEEAFQSAHNLMNTRERHQRRGDAEALILIIADVDKLKMINDIHGHSAGDDVIKYIAKALENGVRYFGNGDVVARWAGDEFAILLSIQDADEAEAAAQKVESRISELLSGGGPTVTTGSFISYRDDSMTPQELFDMADDAMYIRKRNRPR